MKPRLSWILTVIAVIIGYLFQSSSEKKLLFLDQVINDNINNWIFSNPLYIIITLGSIYIIVKIIIWINEKDVYHKKCCSNICQYIFRFIESKIDSTFMQYIRVTIFKAKNINSNDAILEFYSRYQIRTPNKKTKLKFKPGEGCAGICFESQQVISKRIQEYDKSQKKRYIDESKNELNISEKQIQKLNIKSCSFLGIPVKFYDSGKTWGVLLIDSIKWHDEFVNIAREIDNIMNHYMAFFTEV